MTEPTNEFSAARFVLNDFMNSYHKHRPPECAGHTAEIDTIGRLHFQGHLDAEESPGRAWRYAGDLAGLAVCPTAPSFWPMRSPGYRPSLGFQDRRKKLDKDRFRRIWAAQRTPYQEVLRRVLGK